MVKNNTPVDKNSREYLLRQVANGRYSLLLIVILTVVNLIMTVSKPPPKEESMTPSS